MGIKFGTEPCKRAKNNRGCIYKHQHSSAIGEGIVKQIWGCRRCGEKIIKTINHKDVECAISPTTKCQWQKVRQISFQQHYRHRDIEEEQKCSCCGSVRIYSYQSMIGYQPKRY